jgi:hypothetical protein
MGRKGIIRFRCWYCNRKHVAGWDQVGQRRVCHCGERYRVPRSPGISWRNKTILDRFLEFAVYGGGCALLGFGVGLLIAARFFLRRALFLEAGILVGGLTLAGLMLGGLLGEFGVNWLGSLLRHEEDFD